MTDNKFNPKAWLSTDTENKTKPSEKVKSIQTEPTNDVEAIVSRIEAQGVDITSDYADWRDIGFALADELGEGGRNLFHRVSRFHAEYNQSDCNKQYDKCLQSKGNGINIQTLFYKAKQAGVNIVVSQSKANSIAPERQVEKDSAIDDDRVFNTPTLPSALYNDLPEILKSSTDLFEDAIEKDVFLIGSLAVLSGCLPNVQGFYFNEPYTSHLFVFITAPAGSGKGKLNWAKYWGETIHRNYIDASATAKAQFEYEQEEYYNMKKSERQNAPKPEEPPQRMLYIPANSSSSAFILALYNNDFTGIIFESEADTLAQTFKQEWGNFSDVLRKSFHHESTNMFRRKDGEFMEIKDPHLAIALSGTPKQISNLVPDAENGLFSRFLYYAFEGTTEFKNPFLSYRDVDYTEFFAEKGKQIMELNEILSALEEPLVFKLTIEQQQEFTKVFNDMLNRNMLLLGNDFNANIKRLGLITFRIAMILSVLRILEDGNVNSPIVCADVDFQSALQLAITLEKHAVAVYKNLPSHELKGKQQKFFDKLPVKFDRQGYLQVAEQLNIKPKTAEKYLANYKKAGLLYHEHNFYEKK